MRWRLGVAHTYPDGRYLEAGTVVGDRSPYPWPMLPSPDMIPLDEDGLKKSQEVHDAMDRDAPGRWPRHEVVGADPYPRGTPHPDDRVALPPGEKAPGPPVPPGPPSPGAPLPVQPSPSPMPPGGSPASKP